MAAKYNLKINQGSNLKLTIRIKDSDGVAIDLTGHTFRGQIRKKIKDTDILQAFSFNVLDQNDVDTVGQVEILLTSTETTALPVSIKASTEDRNLTYYVYDIESVKASFVTRWLEGFAVISPEVTR